MGLKMYKTTYIIEVLSEEPLGEVNLQDLHYEITDGHCSGVFASTTQIEITEFQMAKELIMQGSDPEFFLSHWVECPVCLGKSDIDAMIPCWKCYGINLVSPETYAEFFGKDKEDEADA